MRRSETESTIVNFLSLIGLEVAYTDLPDDTFLPGLYIQDGRILIDRLRLKHSGDLLHEQGILLSLRRLSDLLLLER